MKKYFYFLLPVFFFYSTINAQLIKPANSEFSDNLNKIIQSFKTNYLSIQGDALPSGDESDVFRSKVSLPGSLQSVIYRFNSKKDTSASWQALMFQGETFEEALKIYRNTTRLLNKSRLVFPGKSPVGFSGKFNEPDPNVAFANSSFKLNTDDPAFEKYYAEIEMINTGFDSWEVHLNLHNKKDDKEKY